MSKFYFCRQNGPLGLLSSENVPTLCFDLLSAGYDTPTLRILAGLPTVELDEVPGAGSDIDQLIKDAEAQRREGSAITMAAAIGLLSERIPAGHVLPQQESGRWTQIGSHRDVPVMLVHNSLPFAFIRWEYRSYVQPIIDKLRIDVADISSVEMQEISLTQQSLTTLADREVESSAPLPWLSADRIMKLTV